MGKTKNRIIKSIATLAFVGGVYSLFSNRFNEDYREFPYSHPIGDLSTIFPAQIGPTTEGGTIDVVLYQNRKDPPNPFKKQNWMEIDVGSKNYLLKDKDPSSIVGVSPNDTIDAVTEYENGVHKKNITVHKPDGPKELEGFTKLFHAYVDAIYRKNNIHRQRVLPSDGPPIPPADL